MPFHIHKHKYANMDNRNARMHPISRKTLRARDACKIIAEIMGNDIPVDESVKQLRWVGEHLRDGEKFLLITLLGSKLYRAARDFNI